MAEGARDEVRYTAFLSYSHKDAAAAGKLHRRLESYRMPKRLAGTGGARGPVPERLAPIFRDREELPAASDLSDTVRAALAQSGALIILCSPEAAESLWVAEEIETFRTLHPDRPILAAILDGDPPDCFPAALRAFGRDGTWHEPLATDLRRGKDGAQLGLLKLVAGITGVGLDELVQRDAARKIRRVMAVTGAALVAMLIMAALAGVALQARAEAERQRAEAEGLIEFMLTELREKLRGAAGIEIRNAVNQRALAYYGGQEQLERLSPDSLERRARILHAIGEVDIEGGNLAPALVAFREAHRTTAEQLARAPTDPVRIFNHGQSEYWVGRIFELRGDWPETRRQYALYAAAAQRLIEIAPDNPDYMLEMAWGRLNRGIVQKDGERNPAAAQISFQEAIDWFERALRARPRDVDARDLANAYGYLADSYYARSLWQPSLRARLQEYRINEPLQRADPTNLEKAYRLAIAERSIARLSDRIGDRGGVREFLLKAYERVQLLAASDSRNADWLLLRTKVECDLFSQVSSRDRPATDAQLAERIRAAGVIFSRQGNPRISEIRICLDRARSGQGHH